VLGDVIISLDMVKIQNPEHEDFEIIKLLVHGICHLIGYVHHTDEHYIEMNLKETELLKIVFGKKLACFVKN
jgi:rRNA maturation RNase YbeY